MDDHVNTGSIALLYYAVVKYNLQRYIFVLTFLSNGIIINE